MVIGDWGFQLSLGNLNLWRTTGRLLPLSAIIRRSIFDIYLSVKEVEQGLGSKIPETSPGYKSVTVRLTIVPDPGSYWPLDSLEGAALLLCSGTHVSSS